MMAKKTCEYCERQFLVDGVSMVDCDDCDGSGEELCEHCDQAIGDCNTCEGTAEIPCPECEVSA